ncbi:MAG: hypothetical protein KAG92_06630 [Deltaproteobacteria bacterium]|nr:hypothetical protein [Deltaproteobacteria bacterium]
MPLTFPTLHHGNIAFGFFNIESDMLLLQQYFFFADSYCAYVSSCADHKTWDPEGNFQIYKISNPANVGDLMGAIHGTRYTGFIGETYRQFPFPEDPAAFKQNPEGFKTQDIIRTMIEPYAEISNIPFTRQENRCVRIGDYTFDRSTFQELLHYVEQGGYPRWKDKTTPDYVKIMKKRIDKSSNDMFDGIKFD